MLRCGYVVHRESPDYGIDLRIVTFYEEGFVEGESVAIQLKASDTASQYELLQDEVLSFPVETKDYQLWARETIMPVFLVLYDAILEEGYWLDIHEWDRAHLPTLTQETVRVHIPRHQILDIQTIKFMRRRKHQLIDRVLDRDNEGAS